MLFSTTRFFSRAAVAFEEAAARAPRRSPVYSEATLAKRALKKAATPPVKKPSSGFIAFLSANDLHAKKGQSIAEVAKANGEKWKALSEEDKKEATDKYHKTVTQWYSGLSDEQKTAALSVKGFPKSIVKSPRQVKYAENNVGKDNAWIEFYTNWRAEHASEIEGKRASEVAKECARAYAPLKEENAKKREAEKTEKKA